MKSRSLMSIMALACLVLTALLFPARYALAGNSYYFGFEESVKPFAPVASAPAMTKSVSLTRVAGGNGCPALLGNSFANLKSSMTSPTSPDYMLPLGTWTTAPFAATGVNQIDVSFWAKNTGNCAGCSPMVYIGAAPPTLVRQFSFLDTDLKDTWQHFRYTRVLNNTQDVAYLAIGWPGVYASIGIDCVSVNVSSIASGAATSTVK